MQREPGGVLNEHNPVGHGSYGLQVTHGSAMGGGRLNGPLWLRMVLVGLSQGIGEEV